jgi:hypothetical protein
MRGRGDGEGKLEIVCRFRLSLAGVLTIGRRLGTRRLSNSGPCLPTPIRVNSQEVA